MDIYAFGIKPKLSKRRDELGHVQNGFVQMAVVLESEKQKQNRIIASISHDIKTPLTSVLGYTGRLQKDNMDLVRRQKYLDTIYKKSKSIQEIIEEIDEYLGFNMQGSLKKQWLTVSDICEMVRRTLRRNPMPWVQNLRCNAVVRIRKSRLIYPSCAVYSEI